MAGTSWDYYCFRMYIFAYVRAIILMEIYWSIERYPKGAVNIFVIYMEIDAFDLEMSEMGM